MIPALFRITRHIALVCALPAMASAQDVVKPSSPPIRLGVVAVEPRFSVTQIGIDTNVFNSAENPQRDQTATAATGVTLSVRTGRGLLTVDGDAGFLYFEGFASERALSSSARANYGVRFNRLRPFAWVATHDQKDRPNDEINTRVRHYGTDLAAGIDVRLFSRSTARLEWRQERSGFAESAIYNGRPLPEALNRTAQVFEGTWRQQLTAQTTWVAQLSRYRDEYEFERARNAEGYMVRSGFELGQLALIRGQVLVGYQQLRADDPDLLREYSGLTAQINIAYSAPTRTRFEVAVDSELRDSYDSRTPHYTQQSWNARITQHTFGRWDVQVSGGRAAQDYAPSATFTARRDYVDRVGGGIGFSLAKQVRLSVDVTSVNRRSDLPIGNYRGLTSGFSVTHGS